MNSETFLSGFLVVFSLVALAIAKGFPGTAAYLPMAALIILGTMSGIVLFHALRRKTTDGPEDRIDPKRDFNLRVILTFIFFLSFDYVSYRVTAPLYIVLICRLSGISWRNSILSSVISSVITYVLFIMWLHVYIEF